MLHNIHATFSLDDLTGCIRNIRILCFLVFLLSLSVMELHEFKDWINTNLRPPCVSPVCHSPLTLARSLSRGQVIEQFVGVSERQEGMAKNYSTSFREKAVGTVYGGMRPKMVCRQLNISRSQLCLRFWERDVWPGNSPDLKPIENL